MKEERPIGMFDSGIGGLTVMDQLIRRLPHEDIIYFGDTARLPYGNKSRDTIIRYSIENSIFLIEKNIKILVVACNTATSHAVDKLQQIFGVPVVGVIEPGARRAVEQSKSGRIAVLGTKGTIGSEAYQRAIKQINPHAYVLPIACPLFVPLVEEGCFAHPATSVIVKEYLKPVLEQGIDTLLLGCTHYPLLKEVLEKEVGNDVAFVDPGAACAEQVSHLLEQMEMRKVGKKVSYEFFVSDDPSQFQRLGSAFLGRPIDAVHSR